MHNIKDGNAFTQWYKGQQILKKLNQQLTPDDIETLKSIQEAYKEIENGRGGTAKVSEFFKKFAKW